MEHGPYCSWFVHAMTCELLEGNMLSSFTPCRCSGLMVSAFSSRSSYPDSIPARDIALGSCRRHLNIKVPLSTQVYKWVLQF